MPPCRGVERPALRQAQEPAFDSPHSILGRAPFPSHYGKDFKAVSRSLKISMIRERRVIFITEDTVGWR